jgi:hypothetical protein
LTGFALSDLSILTFEGEPLPSPLELKMIGVHFLSFRRLIAKKTFHTNDMSRLFSIRSKEWMDIFGGSSRLFQFKK